MDQSNVERDIELLKKISSGDSREANIAFTELHKHYFRKFSTIFSHGVSNKEDIKDLCQQAFINIMERSENIVIVCAEPGRAPKDYFYTVCRNLRIDYWRKQGRAGKIFAEPAPADPDDPSAAPGNPEGSLEVDYARYYCQGKALAEFESKHPRCHHMLHLKAEGFSDREITEQIKQEDPDLENRKDPEALVRQRLTECRRKLRKLIEQICGKPSE